MNQNSAAQAIAKFLGGIGGACVVAGLVFFTAYGTDAGDRTLISVTGAAFFSQLMVAFGVKRGA